MNSNGIIAVTGGAGYVGSLLVPALLKAKYRVRVIDNMMYGVDSLLPVLSNPLLEVVKADVRNSLKKYVADADAVIHLAAISGFPACADNPSAARAINIAATQQLIRSLTAKQLLIYASTTSFYGDAPGVSDESSPAKPVSEYGKTKYRAEQIVMQRPNSIALRFATLFGVSPRMRVDLLVNDFVRRALYERYLVLFEADTKRTFLHVGDAVRAYLLTLQNADKMIGNAYNVGSEKFNFSKADIAEAIRDKTGCVVTKAEIGDFDVRNFETSFAKIQKFGFKPHISLDTGVQELVKLYEFYQPYPTFHTI